MAIKTGIGIDLTFLLVSEHSSFEYSSSIAVLCALDIKDGQSCGLDDANSNWHVFRVRYGFTGTLFLIRTLHFLVHFLESPSDA
jgi:hypothetical protein